MEEFCLAEELLTELFCDIDVFDKVCSKESRYEMNILREN
jgi:hypothetical protein